MWTLVTTDSVLEAADFVAALERRQGFRISLSEGGRAFSQGYIDRDQLERLGVALRKSA